MTEGLHEFISAVGKDSPVSAGKFNERWDGQDRGHLHGLAIVQIE